MSSHPGTKRASRWVAVVGPEDATLAEGRMAEEVGALLAGAGAIVLTGGLGGVMAAASKGARTAGGATVGLLPGLNRDAANEWVQFALPTGLGELRNGLIVRAAGALIAIGTGWGTLSEVGFALKIGVPVISLDSWAPDGSGLGSGVILAESPAQAVEQAIGSIGQTGS